MAERTRLHVGTSGFAYKEWKGAFYPSALPASGMLPYYADHFHTVEINSTFYRLPSEDALLAWAEAVPADFTFAFKAPQTITHRKRLREADESTERFLSVIKTLGGRLGPALFQLPPNFKKDLERLEAFLELLPAEMRIAFGFRHPETGSGTVRYEATEKALRGRRSGLRLRRGSRNHRLEQRQGRALGRGRQFFVRETVFPQHRVSPTLR